MTKKTDWENFCQQHGIAEDEIKTQLFNGELSENDFCYINKNIQDNVFLNGPRYSIDYYRLFNACPHLVERCNWNMLDGRSWIELLKNQPEFSDKCNWTKLTVKQDTPLVSFVNGGQQEFARRAGTENVASIVGMATALKNNCSQMHENTLKLQKMETLLKEIISESISDVVFNGDPVHHLPGLISLSIPGASGESLLHILDLKGIAVSTGAACNSKDTEISHVLKSMNLPVELAKGTLRISFGKNNTLPEAEDLAKKIIEIVKKIKQK